MHAAKTAATFILRFAAFTLNEKQKNYDFSRNSCPRRDSRDSPKPRGDRPAASQISSGVGGRVSPERGLVLDPCREFVESQQMSACWLATVDESTIQEEEAVLRKHQCADHS